MWGRSGERTHKATSAVLQASAGGWRLVRTYKKWSSFLLDPLPPPFLRLRVIGKVGGEEEEEKQEVDGWGRGGKEEKHGTREKREGKKFLLLPHMIFLSSALSCTPFRVVV